MGYSSYLALHVNNQKAWFSTKLDGKVLPWFHSCQRQNDKPSSKENVGITVSNSVDIPSGDFMLERRGFFQFKFLKLPISIGQKMCPLTSRTMEYFTPILFGLIRVAPEMPTIDKARTGQIFGYRISGTSKQKYTIKYFRK